MSVAVGISATTGVSVTLIIAVLFVGTALLMAVWQDYDEIDFCYDHGVARLHLKRNRSTTRTAESEEQQQPETPIEQDEKKTTSIVHP